MRVNHKSNSQASSGRSLGKIIRRRSHHHHHPINNDNDVTFSVRLSTQIEEVTTPSSASSHHLCMSFPGPSSPISLSNSYRTYRRCRNITSSSPSSHLPSSLIMIIIITATYIAQ